eukprot:s1247_g31.t1
MSVCGEAQEEFSLCPGRSSPELASALYHLESFCCSCEDLQTGYMQKETVPFRKDPDLLKPDEYPELQPYRSLDASRLKIVGEGKWQMEQYLDGPLWLPFQEPAFLHHGLECSDTAIPNFSAECPLECLKLAKVWDARGLLFLCPSPVVPGHFSRVFNAFKDKDRDRQIGDRRLPNLAEYHIDGPSKPLPQGQQLTQLCIPRFTHVVRGSMTDRRDFYHQACVTPERARSNMLPYSFPLVDFQGTSALDSFVTLWNLPVDVARERVGDFLAETQPRKKAKSRGLLPASLYPCFASLFQGDQFALRSHSLLLENHGLLDPSTRLLGGHVVPCGFRWDALVIDDYFALGAEKISAPADQSFAMRSLQVAREVYQLEGLLGSPEKDVVAETSIKAAGAEIRSHESNARKGFVPVGAPFAKRIALATLSLRAAALPGVTAELLARLVGNWVSVLQYRKCLSSLVDGLFKFSSDCLDCPDTLVHNLSRAHAQELVLLAVMSPLMFSNIAVDYLETIFATDASLSKGAVVKTSIGKEVQEFVWQAADKKGSYTHLDNAFRAILRHVASADEDLETAGPSFLAESIVKQPLMYFDFVEICGGAGKVTSAMAELGHSVAPVLDLSNSRHYDLGSGRLTEWIIYMLEENRFRSFLVAPPCTSFSPAAHPAVRSYREPLGFDRLNPKTLLGNLLAFRTLLLLRVGRRCSRPCAAEQSRLSKMCWLALWRSLLDFGFSEAVIASCMFGSIHKKEFRLLCHMLDTVFLDCRCQGGHSHVRIQGAYTKPSAVYVDGLAHHIAPAFHTSLVGLDACEKLSPSVEGLESVVCNDVMQTSKWETVRAWFWKKPSHINVLELASAVSCLGSVASDHSSVRFANFLDSAVCRGALAKGRSASHALQPGLKRAAAWCVCFDLYPAWPFSPTRLNAADDPTRDVVPREPHGLSLVKLAGREVLGSVANGLRRFPTNWTRLVILLLCTQSSEAISVNAGFRSGLCFSLFWTACAVGLALCLCFGLCLGHCLFPTAVRCVSTPYKGPIKTCPFRKPVRVAMVCWLLLCPACAMPLAPQTEAERQRFWRRDGNQLFAMRAIKQPTRDKRKVYLTWFREWLWAERQVSFRALIDQRPPDPERIAELLVEYGKALYRAGKTYGVYSETINSVAVERPLIRRQLTTAWDLAFAWLQDEPHSHHPAMPLSVMAAMVVVSALRVSEEQLFRQSEDGEEEIIDPPLIHTADSKGVLRVWTVSAMCKKRGVHALDVKDLFEQQRSGKMTSPTRGKTVRGPRTVATRGTSPGASSPRLGKTLSPQNSMGAAFLTGLDLESENDITRSQDPTRSQAVAVAQSDTEVQLLFEEEGHDDAGIISMYLTEEPNALMTTGLDRRVRTWSSQLDRLGTLMQSQDRHFKFPFDPQAAQEVRLQAAADLLEYLAPENRLRLPPIPGASRSAHDMLLSLSSGKTKPTKKKDAEKAWRVTAEQVMQAPEDVEEDDFRMLFEQMERGSMAGYPLESKERLVKVSKALQAKQMVHRASALSKEEAFAAERLAHAMAALGGDDYGTYAAMANSLKLR